MTIRVVRLGAGDGARAQRTFQLMAEVFEEPFEERADDEMRALLDAPTFWAFAALDGDTLDGDTGGDTVIGGLTAHTLPMTRDRSCEVFIYDIAVAGEHQRKGVGRALVDAVTEAARAAGIDVLFVPADADDVDALAFYRALGGTPQPVTFFEFGA